MKILLPLVFSLLIAALPAFAANPEPATTGSAKAKKSFAIYAQFVEDTMVELSDGSTWMMDKGDCFPVYMFKDQQTNVILQLADSTFWTRVIHVRIMKEAERKIAEESYRKTVENYHKAKAKAGQRRAKS
jgi:hypothetical protein